MAQAPRIRVSSARLVDAYAQLLADKADLVEREKELQAKLFAAARRDADGVLIVQSGANRVSISEVAPSETFDAAKAKGFLKAAQIAACMKPKAGYLRFNCKARVAVAA
jgi:hypothetical protein